VYFPHYDQSEWLQISCESHQPDDINKFVYHFIVRERK